MGSKREAGPPSPDHLPVTWGHVFATIEMLLHPSTPSWKGHSTGLTRQVGESGQYAQLMPYFLLSSSSLTFVGRRIGTC